MDEHDWGERDAPGYWRDVRQQKREVLNVRAEALRQRSPSQRVLARVARLLASPWFFLTEIFFHTGWLLLNSGWIARITPWDPYPFPFLLGLASAQALFIGLLILMHTQQEARISEVREETDLQAALHSEREATKLLQMMADVHQTLGIPPDLHEKGLREMMRPLDPEQLRAATEEDLNRSENESNEK